MTEYVQAAISIILSVITTGTLFYFYTYRPLITSIDRMFEDSRKDYENWVRERQQLLDRIQAPTYDHLKHHEAKIIKAQQPKEEKPQIELV